MMEVRATMRRVTLLVLAGSVLAVGVLAPARLAAQEYTAGRQLKSRALFVALDSTSLADSAGMEPMRPDEATDSVMLDMVAYLDRTAGAEYRLGRTRVRRWPGFGTQAHPTMGILVDSGEVAWLLGEVRRYKGQAGVPEEKIEPRLEYVIRFMMAHEYGHLMQYRYFGTDSVLSLNATRVIECAADLLGGFELRGFLASRYAEASFPEAAEQAAIDFGYIVGANDWLDGTTHPLREDRRLCIGRGVDAQRALVHARGSSMDSLSQALRRWARDSEPELTQGPLDLVAWAQLRARAIVSAREIVDSNAVLAVVRDSSPVRLVRELAAASAEGGQALRRFRGPRAPRAPAAYLLREALPVPWECLTAEYSKAESALCTREGREPDFLEPTFDRLVASVGQTLRGTPWRRIQASLVSPLYPNRDREILGKALYGVTGSRPNDPRAARIEVLFVKYPAPLPLQIGPRYGVTLFFRAKR